jgi:predicted DNA-binding WGR domain protein
MKRTFINQIGESNKFWTIELNENSYSVSFGKIGTKGRDLSKQFEDSNACLKEVESLIAEKQRKGYTELLNGEAIPEKTELTYRPMDEDVFWEIISSFNWKKTGDDAAVLRPALKRLVSMTENDIHQFAEILAEKLYLLDGLVYASNIGNESYKGEGQFFSVDYFLYVRCCVIANGKNCYNHIIKHPTEMPKEMDFEALLYLAEEAYSRKSKSTDELPATKFSFETFSNAAAWEAIN